MNSIYVVGHFDDENGKSSKIGETLFNEIKSENTTYFNGGSFRDLENILDSIRNYQLIYWFADVPNDKPKIVNEIKNRNNACILITSKRNVNNQYTFMDLVFHALNIKSNLFVEITRENDRYNGRIIDPLGNVFLDYNENFGLVGKVLRKRVNELSGFRRVSSLNIGSEADIPYEDLFFEIIRGYAQTFHDLINPVSVAANRFFGNASFRCERGFPSFKSEDNMIFVSRRNVDKRFIDRNSFVGVRLENPVSYFGERKPSVDTPIQLELYSYYPKVRYMIHSHTYVSNAPFTNRIIPCGAVEEAEEIKEIFPDRNSVNFYVNLKGHGSLSLVDNFESLKNIPYIARGMPEVHLDYLDYL